jgi:hypothetical protein
MARDMEAFMKSILIAAAFSLLLAAFTLQWASDPAASLVLAQDNTPNSGDTFSSTNPGTAPLPDSSLDSGPPSDLDNGAGTAGSTSSAGFSENSTSQSLSTGPISQGGGESNFGGNSSSSGSLSEPPLSH